jgi:hypothetical protein
MRDGARGRLGGEEHQVPRRERPTSHWPADQSLQRGGAGQQDPVSVGRTGNQGRFPGRSPHDDSPPGLTQHRAPGVVAQAAAGDGPERPPESGPEASFSDA